MISKVLPKQTPDIGMMTVIFILLLPIFAAAEGLRPFTSDGCSLFPEGSAADNNLWCECCVEHDMAYWQGGTALQKERADLKFKACIAEKSGDAVLAETMYLAVTIGGKPYFPTWYRWGYGWPFGRGYDELTADEMRLASVELERYRRGTVGTEVCPVSLPKESSGLRHSASDLAADAQVIFFNTFAMPPQGGELWTIPIHGWVYEPKESVVRKGVFAALLKESYGLAATARTQANFDQRVNLFLADDERGKNMVIRLGEQIYLMPPTQANGHFHAELKIQESAVRSLMENHMLAFSLVLDGSDPRGFQGTVLIPDIRGVSVISDIDDTVKVTLVRDSKRMLENTFINDFVAVPGMADLFRHWAEQGAIVHFVSSSPWQLYTPIYDFLNREAFPPATFSLKYLRFTDKTLLNLFKSGEKTKPEQIEAIIRALPGHQFILVGDSGEQDPEVYAGIARKYPDQVTKIYIRRVGLGTMRDFEALFSGIPAKKWRLFTHPEELQGINLPSIK